MTTYAIARWSERGQGSRTAAQAHQVYDHYAVGMKDPEGNEFDIN